MSSPESRRIAAALITRAGEGAHSEAISDAMVATWQEIDSALQPIIGHQGVAALYKRSLHLTSPNHLWLASAHASALPPMDLDSLKAVLMRQTAAQAALGGAGLLQTFYGLLASMVGPSLTERLLRSVWADLLSGSPAQDTFYDH